MLERVGWTGDVVVDERPQHEHDGVDLADVGQELVAEALTLAGALDEPADVDDLDRCVDRLLRLRHHGELVETIVGHLGDADVRVLRGERVRRGERTTAGERVVQRTLARVGETDQTETFHEPSRGYRPRPSRRVRAAPFDGLAQCRDRRESNDHRQRNANWSVTQHRAAEVRAHRSIVARILASDVRDAS